MLIFVSKGATNVKRTNFNQSKGKIAAGGKNKQLFSNQMKNLHLNVSSTNQSATITNKVAKSSIEEDMEKTKPKKNNIKYPILPPRASVNQAMTLQTETNNLLKHIISQNNKQIQLLTKLLEK